jgi:hypothetical protein
MTTPSSVRKVTIMRARIWFGAVVCSLAVIIGVAIPGCKKSDESPTTPAGSAYDQLITDAWTLFSQTQYQQAGAKFTEAKANDASRPEAYAGAGWSSFKQNDLVQAAAEFSAGGGKAQPPVDLFAGWAFVLNAQKDYTNSNTKVDSALAKNRAWNFSHGLPLNTSDLHVLKAENFFMLGNFTVSLAEVRILNPAFTADVAASTGIALLAQEIERLKSIS